MPDSRPLCQTHDATLATSIAHYVVSLGPDGRIVSCGSATMAECNDLQLTVQSREVEGKEESQTANNKLNGAKLVAAEDIVKGRVSLAASRSFLHFLCS